MANIRDFAECTAKEAEGEVNFENVTDAEKENYNLMDNSRRMSDKLVGLEREEKFDLANGVQTTLRVLHKIYKRMEAICYDREVSSYFDGII